MARLDILQKVRDGALVRYFRETWYEVKKVSWPNRREATNLTLMVIAVTSFLSIILGLMDYVFQSAFALLLKSLGGA